MTETESKTVNAPPSFVDGEGHTWTIKLTLAEVNAVQRATGLDLLAENQDPSELVGLLFADRKLADVLWILSEKTARTRDLDRDGFLSLCDAPFLAAGWGALVDSVVFFIRTKNQRVGDAIQEAIDAQVGLLEAGAMQIQKTLKSEKTRAALSKAADNLGRQLSDVIDRECDNSALNLGP